MKKTYPLFVRISAVILSLALIGLYIATLVFSLMNTASAQWLFRASIAATFFVPVILYMLLLVTKNQLRAHQESLLAMQAETTEDTAAPESAEEL